MTKDDEAETLRAVALRNASSILIARQRAEQELSSAKEALERKSEALAQALLEREQLLASERAARASAEQMSQLKDEFLTNLSHELRTPLNAIIGWASMLRRPDRKECDVHKGLETIERNARAQKQLIDDLLDMSSIISGKVRLDVRLLDPIGFIEAALDTARPAANAKSIDLERSLDPAAGPISGDPDRLQQVMWNLLSNAIKFTPCGGKVVVRLARVGSHVEVDVTDTGIGVTPEFLPHMFDRLRQADSSSTKRYCGLGLGLSIVKHMVELHGGSARAQSRGVGLGTSVTLQMPLAAAASDPTPPGTRSGVAAESADER